jgi:hypothetical protein
VEEWRVERVEGGGWRLEAGEWGGWRVERGGGGWRLEDGRSTDLLYKRQRCKTIRARVIFKNSWNMQIFWSKQKLKKTNPGIWKQKKLTSFGKNNPTCVSFANQKLRK